MARHTLFVGQIAGVPLRVHWTWPLVTLAVVGGLAEIYARDPGIVAPWAAALAAALLLTLSMLLHELAHALVARALGMQVHGIAVLALGGVTEIADDDSTAGRELLVSLAGPAASLALALAATLAWWLGVGLQAVTAHLALANWALTLFNLLPGHLLDGGRALKAVLWFLGGEELPAGRAAAQVARALGWGLILLGLADMLATGDGLNALWLMVVGLFLSLNAMSGYRRLALQRALRGVTASDLMRRAYRSVTPEMSLERFVGQYMSGMGDHGFPVVTGDAGPHRLVGMMTLRNLGSHPTASWAVLEVSQVMTPASHVRVLAPDTSARDALRALMESGEELLPVVEGEVLSGVLRRADVVGYVRRVVSF
ncbi:MAG: hypothetical protein RLZZ387_982 [Chloroflexota bacterium]|jgi:Zn-dependent protease